MHCYATSEGIEEVHITISFQPDIVAVMREFDTFEAKLRTHVVTATEKSAGRIGDEMIALMDSLFKNPTGALARSVGVDMVNEYMATVGPTLAYSWRRDRGFSGMTDSLSRFYPLDPGIFYAELSIEDAATLVEVTGNFGDAILKTWEELIGSLPQAAMMVSA